MVIRVLVGEDNYLLREGIVRILADATGLELVGSCGDFDCLRAMIEEARPDVVLTDIRMPPTNTDEGIRLATELRTTHPEIGVVVLSQHASSVYATTLLADGAAGRGYVLKDRVADKDDLIAIIRDVASGGSHLDSQVIDVVFHGWGQNGQSSLAKLTPRELEVLELVAAGDTNTVIAEKLGVGRRAVERHVNSIFEKLELRDAERVSRRVTAAIAYLAWR
jgi:DNA-binding NarL/FixJ family response regulator